MKTETQDMSHVTFRLKMAKAKELPNFEVELILLEVSPMSLEPLQEVLCEMGFKPSAIDAVCQVAREESFLEALRNRMV